MDGTEQTENMPPQSTPQSSLQTLGNIGANGPRDYPKTPAGRVPLKELIGNSEEQNELQSSPTPVDQVLWKHSPSNLDEENIQLMPWRKDKKRARSSSPHLEQLEVVNHLVHHEERTSFDLQNLQRSLKTPQADPAGDLWSRYSLPTTDKKASDDVTSPTLANFLNSSSPQTPARYTGVQESGGLRRTMSCGLEWPVSAAKRRKVTRNSDRTSTRESVGVAAGQNADSDCNISRVNLLLEKIQHGFKRSATELERLGPSSSSPLERTSAAHSQHVSQFGPTKSVKQGLQEPVKELANQPAALATRSSQNPHTGEQSCSQGTDKTPVSEFGSDGIDLDLLNEVDASIRATSLRDIKEETLAPLGNTSTPPLEDTHVETKKDEFDDIFDGSDEDLLAADLEEVAALYDQRGLPAISEQVESESVHGDEVHPNSAPKKASIEVSSDDEFGDDLDFEEIAVEYVRATQGDVCASNIAPCR